jgi:secreted trypsin-like serine protease
MKALVHALSLVLLIALAAGCAAEENVAAQPLRAGTFTHADPAVGLLRIGATTCTATLIDAQTLVTAARCTRFASGPIAGTFFLESAAGTTMALDLRASRSFGSATGRDDVAVVLLARAVPPFVATPIPVSEGAVLTMGERVVMYGHGCRLSATEPFVPAKQRIETYFDRTVHGCSGDDGGPLLMDLGQGRRAVSLVMDGTLEGVPSYGLVHKHAAAIRRQIDAWTGTLASRES